MMALDELLDWLKDGGEVGIFDATNSTRARRAMVQMHAHAKFSRRQLQVIFVESMCSDPRVLDENLRQKVRHSPDYVGVNEETALADLRSRIRNYEKVYQTVDEAAGPEVSYIKVIDLREKIVCYRISGARAQAIVAFLMAVHVIHRPIWLVRAGHCVDTPLDDGRVVDDAAEGAPDAAVPVPPQLPTTAQRDGDGSGGHSTGVPGVGAARPGGALPLGLLSPSGTSVESGGIKKAAGGGHRGRRDHLHLQALEDDRKERLLVPSPSMSPHLGGSSGPPSHTSHQPPPGMPNIQLARGETGASINTPVIDAEHPVLPSAGQAESGAGGPVPLQQAEASPSISGTFQLAPAASASGHPGRPALSPRGRSAGASTAALQISQLGGAFSEALASLIYTRCLEFGTSSKRRQALARQFSDGSRVDEAGSASESRLSDGQSVGIGSPERVGAAGGGASTPSIRRNRFADVPKAAGRPASGAGGALTKSSGIPGGVSATAANALAQVKGNSSVQRLAAGQGEGEADHVEFKGLTALLPSRIRAPTDPSLVAHVLKPTSSSPAIPQGRSSRSGSVSAFSGPGLLPSGPHLPISRSRSIAAGHKQSMEAALSNTTLEREQSDGRVAVDGAGLSSAAWLPNSSEVRMSGQAGLATPSDDFAVGLDLGGTPGLEGTGDDAMLGVVGKEVQEEEEDDEEGGEADDDDNAGGNRDLLVVPGWLTKEDWGQVRGSCVPAVYTSTLPRTIQTAAPVGVDTEQLSALLPMHTGIYAGHPLQALRRVAPGEYSRWKHAHDPVHHRITGGESIADVVVRLSPLVVDLERQRQPVLVVSHLSTIQVLLAYFRGIPLRECISLQVPAHTVIELQPSQYGWKETHISVLPIEPSLESGDQPVQDCSAPVVGGYGPSTEPTVASGDGRVHWDKRIDLSSPEQPPRSISGGMVLPMPVGLVQPNAGESGGGKGSKAIAAAVSKAGAAPCSPTGGPTKSSKPIVLRSVIVRDGDLAHYGKAEEGATAEGDEAGGGAAMGAGEGGAGVPEPVGHDEATLIAATGRHLDVPVLEGLKRAASIPAVGAGAAGAWGAALGDGRRGGEGGKEGGDGTDPHDSGSGGVVSPPAEGSTLPGLRFQAQPRTIGGLGKIE